MYSEFLRIPKERIGVVIGKKGTVKKEIEKRTQTKIKLDSETGEVEILVPENPKDPIVTWKAKEVIKAIARGFNPEIALELLEDDEKVLEVIDVGDYAGKSEKALRRHLGRIIGKEGKAREMLQQLSGAYISVYGKTVAIIGRIDQVELVRRAIEMLLRGASHSTVYKYLEKRRKELMFRGLEK